VFTDIGASKGGEGKGRFGIADPSCEGSAALKSPRTTFPVAGDTRTCYIYRAKQGDHRSAKKFEGQPAMWVRRGNAIRGLATKTWVLSPILNWTLRENRGTYLPWQRTYNRKPPRLSCRPGTGRKKQHDRGHRAHQKRAAFSGAKTSARFK